MPPARHRQGFFRRSALFAQGFGVRGPLELRAHALCAPPRDERQADLPFHQRPFLTTALLGISRVRRQPSTCVRPRASSASPLCLPQEPSPAEGPARNESPAEG